MWNRPLTASSLNVGRFLKARVDVISLGQTVSRKQMPARRFCARTKAFGKLRLDAGQRRKRVACDDPAAQAEPPGRELEIRADQLSSLLPVTPVGRICSKRQHGFIQLFKLARRLIGFALKPGDLR